MNQKRQRLLLFLFGCIGTRTALAYGAKRASGTVLQTMGVLALLPAIGFFLIYFFKLRETGPEVFGEKIWWNSLRPIHGLLYLLFAISAIRKKPYAWMFLAVDVVFGLTMYLMHLYQTSHEKPESKSELL